MGERDCAEFKFLFFKPSKGMHAEPKEKSTLAQCDGGILHKDTLSSLSPSGARSGTSLPVKFVYLCLIVFGQCLAHAHLGVCVRESELNGTKKETKREIIRSRFAVADHFTSNYISLEKSVHLFQSDKLSFSLPELIPAVWQVSVSVERLFKAQVASPLAFDQPPKCITSIGPIRHQGVWVSIRN